MKYKIVPEVMGGSAVFTLYELRKNWIGREYWRLVWYYCSRERADTAIKHLTGETTVILVTDTPED